MNNIIEVTNLEKKYGDINAVNGVSFNVEKGEVFGILGPNGAVKHNRGNDRGFTETECRYY